VNRDQATLTIALRLGDNALVLGQRLSEVVTRAPELEEELANANFALDYIGQARMFYSYAGELEGAGRTEDDFAFLRHAAEFQNVLLVEQPNGHFGDIIARQFLFESFHVLQLEALAECSNRRISEIAARSVKEIRYHLRHVTQWLVRLGDGTETSHARMQQSMNDLWRFTGELFEGDTADEIFERECNGPDLEAIRSEWRGNVAAALSEATLTLPDDGWMTGGGRLGRHTEGFGYLLAEMQFMQRAYPGARW
jgi:ring-1,2-phenylacetyl-CoA epoxidase subunit PaaC